MRQARGLRTTKPVAPQQQAQAVPYSFDAPTGGWVTNSQLSKPVKNAARLLENIFPTSTGARFRAGSSEYVDLAIDEPVESLFAYSNGPTRRMFAGIDGSIWDISGAPNEDVTGQSANEYSFHQFDTGAGGSNYGIALNGADAMQLFNGTSWQTGGVTAITAPIAITGIATTSLSFGWAYRSRNYLIEKNSLNVWYLPLNQVGGAATRFTLSGIFKRGGSLVKGGTWSLDAGNGPDDKWFVMTSEGEVAIFQGPDPGATDWSIIGRYDIGKSMGLNADFRAGGDPVLATVDGMVPLSAILTKDPAALSAAAVTWAIDPDWKRQASARMTMPWSALKWTENNMGLVGLPAVNSQTRAEVWAVNLLTGRWGVFTGWDARSMALHNGQAYFGTSHGKVMKAEDGGTDDGETYVCKYIGQFDHMGRRMRTKEIKHVRVVVRGSRPVNVQPSIAVNYQERLPSPPNVAANTVEDTWDNGLWDEAVWDAQGQATVTGRWKSTPGFGHVHAPCVQVSVGNDLAPDTEIVQYDLTFEDCGPVQ